MSEARLAARLNHPNIVQTNEVFEHRGLPVIVMEYLEGETLADRLGKGALPVEQALKIGVEVAEILRDRGLSVTFAIR